MSMTSLPLIFLIENIIIIVITIRAAPWEKGVYYICVYDKWIIYFMNFDIATETNSLNSQGGLYFVWSLLYLLVFF